MEMLLNNNLLKKLDRLQVDLQEMTGEDRKQKLEMLRLELESTNQRQAEVNKHFKGRVDTVLRYCSQRCLSYCTKFLLSEVL